MTLVEITLLIVTVQLVYLQPALKSYAELRPLPWGKLWQVALFSYRDFWPLFVVIIAIEFHPLTVLAVALSFGIVLISSYLVIAIYLRQSQ